MKIRPNICEKNDYTVDENAIEKVSKLLNKHLDNKDEHFANGRLVRNLFDDIIMNQTKRIAQLKGKVSNDMLMLIVKEDVPD